MTKLKDMADMVQVLREAGKSWDQIAQQMQVSTSTVSNWRALQRLIPAGWKLDIAGRAGLVALVSLARQSSEIQNLVVAQMMDNAKSAISISRMNEAIRAAKTAQPDASSRASSNTKRASRQTKHYQALQQERVVLMEEVAVLRQELQFLERQVGQRRTGLEFAQRFRSLLVIESELEDLLTGQLDGLFIPELSRWHAALVRALHVLEAVMQRQQMAKPQEMGRMAFDPLDVVIDVSQTD